VADDGALYFDTIEAADNEISLLLSDVALRERLKAAALRRFNEEFTWEHVAGQYEQLLSTFLS
jgi:glycosyltransferase involved in cell wall biosynthesis